MEYRQLGVSDIRVSRVCLGTMTWGQQNDLKEACAQMDMALAEGVNFFDVAEIYPSPVETKLCGDTESMIGEWLSTRKNRDEIILASKVAGPSGFALRPHRHGGQTRLDAESIAEACEASLKRLQTDYIDLYQIHWPERNVNKFGQLDYSHNPDEDAIPLEESLGALGRLVEAGKIRAIGLSNDTPWGVMKCLAIASRAGLPRPVSVQNPYNLLNRTLQVGLSEVLLRENIGLLAYSPLASGVLTGKYIGGVQPEKARLTLWPEYFSRYKKPGTEEAIEKYNALAQKYNLSLTEMALAFVNKQDFLAANIIGATSLEQLKTDIDAEAIELPEALCDEINQCHRLHSNLAP